MILSNVEIREAIQSGRIVIDPLPQPFFPEVNGGHCPYDTHSVDVTLGDTILVPQGDSMIAIDLSRPGNVAATIKKNSETHKIGSSGFKLEPSQFVLGTTQEYIELPLQAQADRSLAARIEGKSSRARFGILVHFTAPTVHPNFKGHLTLEMINLGAWPFVLTPGMAIAQLIFEEVRGIPIKNDSQFQNQHEPAGVVGKGKGQK